MNAISPTRLSNVIDPLAKHLRAEAFSQPLIVRDAKGELISPETRRLLRACEKHTSVLDPFDLHLREWRMVDD